MGIFNPVKSLPFFNGNFVSLLCGRILSFLYSIVFGRMLVIFIYVIFCKNPDLTGSLILV